MYIHVTTRNTGDGRLVVLANELTALSLTAVRHFVAGENGVIQIMGASDFVGGREGGGEGQVVHDLGGDVVLAQFSSAGFHNEELGRFFKHVEEHERKLLIHADSASAPRSGAGHGTVQGGAWEKVGRHLLETRDDSGGRHSGGGMEGGGNAWSRRAVALAAGAAVDLSASAAVAATATAASLGDGRPDDEVAPSREQLGYLVAQSLQNFGNGRVGGAGKSGGGETKERAVEEEHGGKEGGGQLAPEPPRFVGEREEQKDEVLPPDMRRAHKTAVNLEDIFHHHRWLHSQIALLAGGRTKPERGVRSAVGAEGGEGSRVEEHGGEVTRRVLATVSSQDCLVAVAAVEEGNGEEWESASDVRGQQGGEGLLTVVCLEGGGVGVSGVDPQVVVGLAGVHAVDVSRHADVGMGAVYRFYGIDSEAVGGGRRQVLLEIAEERGFEGGELLDLVHLSCRIASRQNSALVRLTHQGRGGEVRERDGGAAEYDEALRREREQRDGEVWVEDPQVGGAARGEDTGEQVGWEVRGFEINGRPARWVVEVLLAWSKLGLGKGSERGVAGWWTPVVGGENVTQVLGRGEALLLLPGQDGGGRLVWVNATTVRDVRLSEIADLAGNDRTAAVDIVTRGRIVCSVSLECVPPAALAEFLAHLHQVLTTVQLHLNAAVDLAEQHRLPARDGGQLVGGKGVGRGGGLALGGVEVPPSLRNKEVVLFLQRKGVAGIFEDAKRRHVLRGQWALWQRALLLRASIHRLPSPPNGIAGGLSMRADGWEDVGEGGAENDDPVVVLVGGRSRMFAVTRRRILWTHHVSMEGGGKGEGGGIERGDAAQTPNHTHTHDSDTHNLDMHDVNTAQRESVRIKTRDQGGEGRGEEGGMAGVGVEGGVGVKELDLGTVQTVQGSSEVFLCVYVCV